MKVLVIFDSRTGNTEQMAKKIAEGAISVEGVEAEIKKTGESFSLTILDEADLVAFGSPVIYSDVTDNMRSFLEHLERYIKAGKMDIKGKRAAIFGSYGYDGAWVMEERLRKIVEDLGFEVSGKNCVETDYSLRNYLPDTLNNCREFGRKLASSLKK
jgi:flavodoxin